jgi:hypothetical protein
MGHWFGTRDFKGLKGPIQEELRFREGIGGVGGPERTLGANLLNYARR